jgi:hypothetical protein
MWGGVAFYAMERALSYLKPGWFENHFGSSHLSLVLLSKFIAVGVLLVAISDVPVSWNIAFSIARLVIGVLIVAIIVLPIRPALVLFTLLLVAGRDFDTQATASIWQLNIGFVRPSWIVFGLMAIQLYKLRRSFAVPRFIKYSMVWFATVPLIAGLLYGGIADDHAIREWIIDLKFPMVFFGIFVLYSIFLKAKPTQLGVVMAAVVGALAARHLIDLLGFLAGLGPDLDVGISRVSEDSAKAGIVFFVFLGLLLMANQRSKILWGLMIATPALLLVVAYATRMIWIEFVISIPLLLIVIPLKKALVVIAATAAVVLLGGGALYVINQASAERVYDRALYITEGRQKSDFVVDVEYNIVSRVDPIRYAEFLNIFDTMRDRKSWLWGNGYGGYYADDAAEFPLDLPTSFPEYSFETGKFYRSHNFVSNFFHKYGMIGFVLTLLIWGLPGYVLIRELRRQKVVAVDRADLLSVMMLATSAFLLTSMLEMTWSGKGFFINGVLLAIVVEYVLQRRFSAPPESSGVTAVIAKWLR